MDLRSSLLSWKISSPWSSRLSENRPGTSPSKLSALLQISLSNRLWKALLPSVTETLPPLSLCLSNGKPLQNQSHPQNISNGLPKSKNLPMPDDTTCPFFCAAGCPPIIEDTFPWFQNVLHFPGVFLWLVHQFHHSDSISSQPESDTWLAKALPHGKISCSKEWPKWGSTINLSYVVKYHF